MDLKKVKPSKNLEDHTGYSDRDRLLDHLFTLLNPLYAFKQYRDTFLEKGIIKPPTDHPLRKGGW